MAPLLLYAFGPNDAFLFSSPIRISHYNTSQAFKTTVLPRLGTPYSISLGPGPNEYCAFYESREGEAWKSINYPYTKVFHLLYQVANEAVAKVLEEGRDFSKCQLVLGPARTYLFLAPGLPARMGPEGFDNNIVDREVDQSIYQKLLDKVEACNRSDKPEMRIVSAAIGYRGAWSVQLADGHMTWAFGPDDYTELHAFLSSRPCNVDYLALSPDSQEHYFLVYDKTKVKYSLPARSASSVEPLLIEYAGAVKTVTSKTMSATSSQSRVSALTSTQSTSVAPLEDAPPAYSSAILGAQGPEAAAHPTGKMFAS